jgi:hypothetical protein
MKKKIFISIFSFILVFFISTSWVKGATDKSAYNLYGHSTPSTPFDSWFCTFWDEHIDWQTTGKNDYYNCSTRNQVIGSYELAHIFTGSDLAWLYAYYDSAGIHRDSGLAHFNQNTYYCPLNASATEKILVPGWNKVNDVNGNWQRDWDADYDYNNATTYFTVQRTSAPYYIRDAGGGRAGISWATRNKWQNAYVKMGWGADADTFTTTVDSSHADTLYLHGQPSSHTYTWFIVDNPSATNHNAVAMRDTCARIQTNGWGYYLINCRHWKMREFAGRFFHSRVLERPRKPSDIYPDDVLKTCATWSCGSGWCDQIDMGGSCQEGLDDDDIWRPAQRTYLHQIKDSLGTDGFLLANVYEVNDGWDTVIYGGSVDGLWHEGWIDGNNYASHWSNYYTNIRKWMASPYGYNLHFFHAPGGTTNGDANRHRVNCYAQYLLMYQDSVYFLYDTEPYYGSGLSDTTNWWSGIMGRSLGVPSDTAKATTVSGATIWKRSFSNGIVVWKPLPGDGSNYTDQTANISLGGYYYKLTINGNSTSDSVNTVSLMNAESFIGIKTTGGEVPSQINPPQPLSPQNGATVDTTQPTLIIQNTRDPEDRPLLYYFELDYNTQFDSQLKKESTPFELETGQDSTTKWIVPTQLSSGVYYWRSRAYTNTYPSDTSQPSPVYNFQLSTGIGDSLYSLYLLSPVGDELIITLRPTLNAQFIHNGFDRERIRVKFEISEEPSFSTGRTILSPYVNIPEDLSVFWFSDRDLKEGKRYFWRVNIYDTDLLVGISDPGSFFTGSIHVFPNPFKPSKGDSFMTFRNIPLSSKITITTLSGELIRELSGNTTTDVVWDVKNQQGGFLASGAYYYRVDFPSGSTSGKLAIIK